MEILKHEIELNRIKSYVDKHTGYDISTRSRKAEVVLFRTLYFKLATDTTSWSLQKIGKIVNRDHATVLHARKNLFDELMKNKHLSNLYDIYRIEVLGQQVTTYYKDAEQYNRLKEKYNDLLALKIPKNLGYELTKNETAYRKLSDDDKKVYDERAELVLKSFEWKRKDAEREEVYDIIIGEPTVADARASLR
tara:strand:- start:4842 stop:5420 length:579 start_codon:yes stop_codon:yes gene_type:complete